MSNLIELAPTLAVSVVAMGVLMYIVAIFIAALGPALPGSVSERLRAWFISARLRILGCHAQPWRLFP
jgi:hypothetical protein